MRRLYIVSLLLGGGSSAFAQNGTTEASESQGAVPGGVRLSWVRGEGAETCPDAAAIEADVVRRVRRDPFTSPVTQTIEGWVHRNTSGWTARLFDRTPNSPLGTREFESEAPDCASLASAVALAIALTIDPDAALSVPEDDEPPPADTEPIEAARDLAPTPSNVMTVRRNGRATSSAPNPPRPNTARREAASLETSADNEGTRTRFHAAFAFGLLPGIAPGVDLAVDGPIAGALRLVAGAKLYPERRTQEESAEFGFGLSAVYLGACVDGSSDRLFVLGCLTVAVGAIHAVVYEPSPLDPGDYVFAAASGSVEAGLVLIGPLFASIQLTLSIPLVRHQFQVIGRDTVEFQQFAVIPAGSFGLGLRFP